MKKIRTPLSHISPDNRAIMVDTGNKTASLRTARAEAIVSIGAKLIKKITSTGSLDKGNIIETARIAGIMAAKRTHELIPMCHPLPLDVVDIEIHVKGADLVIRSFAKCHSTTGVEMEAMTAASIAALTVYDMCKSAEKGITIKTIRLLEKKGGKSGEWKRPCRKP